MAENLHVYLQFSYNYSFVIMLMIFFSVNIYFLNLEEKHLLKWSQTAPLSLEFVLSLYHKIAYDAIIMTHLNKKVQFYQNNQNSGILTTDVVKC